MNLEESIVVGTLNPDGALELDHKPSLAPGRVQVTVKPITSPTVRRRGLADVIDEIRRDQLARGYHGRTASELAADEAERLVEAREIDQSLQELWAQTTSGAPREKQQEIH